MQKLEQHHIIENLEEHAENLIKKGLVTPTRFHWSSVTYPLAFRWPPMEDSGVLTMGKTRKYLPTIGKICVLATFIEDGTRLITRNQNQFEYLGKVSSGYIDVGDGCWRQNVCEKLKDVGDGFGHFGHRKSTKFRGIIRHQLQPLFNPYYWKSHPSKIYEYDQLFSKLRHEPT